MRVLREMSGPIEDGLLATDLISHLSCIAEDAMIEDRRRTRRMVWLVSDLSVFAKHESGPIERNSVPVPGIGAEAWGGAKTPRPFLAGAWDGQVPGAICGVWGACVKREGERRGCHGCFWGSGVPETIGSSWSMCLRGISKPASTAFPMTSAHSASCGRIIRDAADSRQHQADLVISEF